MSTLQLRRFVAVTAMVLPLVSPVPGAAPEPSAPEALAVPAPVRERFQLAPFYQQYLDAGGMPVVGSGRVQPAALSEAVWIVTNLLAHRPEILRTLGDANVRFAVMAYDEYTTDVPEHAHLKPRVYWDRRARGLGATERAPAVSCGEENLLSYPGDPYPTECLAIHEFAHAIHHMALNRIDPTFDVRLRRAYEDALSRGLWANTYAAVDRSEYWAEAVQSWFDDNRENDSLHNHVNTRLELKLYDPGVAALCEEVFGDLPWRYRRPVDRPPTERLHLRALEAHHPPRFEWRKETVPTAARFLVDCPAGSMEIELLPANAAGEVGALLETIQQGYYGGGQLLRKGELLTLVPGATLPTGEPVPSGARRWQLTLSEPHPGALIVRILRGGDRLPPPEGHSSLPLQRVTRLN